MLTARWAVLGAALVCALGGWLYWRSSQAPLARLGQVYAEQRALEIRLPGMPHGPVRVERGRRQVVPELLEAAATIARRMSNGESGVGWLHAEGRVALIQGDYDGALRSLSAAADIAEPAPELLGEMAAAQFGRAEATRSVSGHTRALELLGQALRKSPTDPAALFSRAVVHEKLMLDEAAVEDWDRLLEIEPGGGWAEEARGRREQSRKRLHQIRSNAPRPVPVAEVELEESLLKWRTFRDQAPGRELASRLRSRHGDPWLMELISQPVADPVVGLLSKLALPEIRMAGAGYAGLAGEIEMVRRMSLPPAWDAWFRFEDLHRLSHTTPAKGCLEAAAGVIGPARRRGYCWILIQSLLERSTCEIASGRLDDADVSTQEAIDLATKAGYAVALARSRGFLSSHLVNQGRYREALAIAVESIRTIHGQNLPRARLHQFYNDIMRSADRMERWHTARAAARMTRRVSSLIGGSGLELLAASKAAEFALEAGDTAAAERDYAFAKELEAKIHKEPSEPRAVAAVALALARKDRRTLAGLDEALRRAANPWWRIPYLLSLAELDRAEGQLADGERRVTEAIEWLSLPRSGSQQAQRWRKALGRAYRLRVLMELDRGRPREALQAWNELRRQEDLLMDVVGASDGPAPEPSQALRVTVLELDGRYGIWWSRAGDTRFRWASAPAAEVNRRARQLLRLCSNPDSPVREIEAVSGWLGDTLFAELAADVAAAPVIEFELDGGIRAAPMQVVRIGGGEPVGTSRPVIQRATSRSGVPALGGLRAALVVAGSYIHPELQSSLRPLAGVEDEARQVAAFFPESRVLVGEEARPGVVERISRRVDAFHYSGHSIVRDDGVSLVLAPDNAASPGKGAWRVPPSWGPKPTVAVLAACATAEAEEFDSVAPHHLAHAFLRAGSRAVVASQWNVDSQTTSGMARHFYEWLSRTQDAARSLHEAAQRIRRSHPHPYYWAPFALYL